METQEYVPDDPIVDNECFDLAEEGIKGSKHHLVVTQQQIPALKFLILLLLGLLLHLYFLQLLTALIIVLLHGQWQPKHDPYANEDKRINKLDEGCSCHDDFAESAGVGEGTGHFLFIVVDYYEEHEECADDEGDVPGCASVALGLLGGYGGFEGVVDYWDGKRTIF